VISPSAFFPNEKMNHPLTKSQLCWVAIRLLGVYFGYSAVMAILTYSSGKLTFGNSVPFLINGSPAGRESGVIYLVFSVGLPFVIGVYLLFGGSLIHRALLSEPNDSFGASTLTPREAEDFVNWLKRNPQYAERPEIDQVALFRDSQSKEKP
jgi:hypothetical protein